MFTLCDDPQFYGLDMSLSNILMIGLFRLNKRMVIFKKNRKKFISQQTRKGPYIYDIRIGSGVVVGSWNLPSFCRFFLFLSKRFIVHFYRWWGLGVTQFVILCGYHKSMTPKWFKITANSVIRGSSFFLNIKLDSF